VKLHLREKKKKGGGTRRVRVGSSLPVSIAQKASREKPRKKLRKKGPEFQGEGIISFAKP